MHLRHTLPLPTSRRTCEPAAALGALLRCHRGIGGAVESGNGDDMPAFPELGASGVDAIQGWLLTLCPAGAASGADLYVSNCASCHGDEAEGTPAPAGERRRPSVRCATPARIADALDVGRADAMPSFPGFAPADLSSLTAVLAQTCSDAGRTPADIWDGNCATCHGITAGGGQNALGVDGPEVQCTGSGDFSEKIAEGGDEMPAFPTLTPDAASIAAWVRGSFCRD